MEEYAESEEEATEELYIVVTQEERPEARTEIKQPREERIKRKMNAEETKIEQGEEDKADEFVSNRVFVIMEQTMLHKYFIGKRGFNRLISPFREVIEK